VEVKRVTEKNLEFITKHLNPEQPIQLNKGENTYLFYEGNIKAVVRQKKSWKKQRVEVTKYDPDFPASNILPVLSNTKHLEVPKEEKLEEILKLINYEKVKEENGYEFYKRKKETISGVVEALKALKSLNIKQQLKDYFQVWEDEPEFKLYEMLNIIENASSGALLGAVTPSFWDYGGVLKLAGTLNAIQKIGTPLTNVFSSGSMGELVDKATGKTELKDLKKLQKTVGSVNAFTTIDTYLMQPGIAQLTPSPELTLLILYTLQTVGMTAGKMSLESKSFFAIRDYLIRKNPETEKHKEKFYRIMGTGQALSQLCYAATFTPSWLICKSNPWLVFPIATVSGSILIVSKFLWAFQRKLKNPITVKAKDYIIKGNSYIFDTGWTLTPEAETEINKKLFSYQLPLKDEIRITSEYPAKIKEKDNHLELLTEKSWIKIKTKQGYELKKISDKEYIIKA
jgi:hypothetical protein